MEYEPQDRQLGVPPDGDAPDYRRLRKAIDLTPDPERGGKAMSDRKFAVGVLGIHEKTLRRYISPDPDKRRPVPGPVRAVVDRILSEHGQAEYAREAAAETAAPAVSG